MRGSTVGFEDKARRTTDLVLSDRESEELYLAVASYLTELNVEIAGSPMYGVRLALEERRAVLQEVLHRLGASPRKTGNDVDEKEIG
ncbi:MAG TPA: hypothetical protein VIG07_10735 [Methylomirabilota bacterium]|jgi:hypothetical protein